jgi:hypothetical protein
VTELRSERLRKDPALREMIERARRASVRGELERRGLWNERTMSRDRGVPCPRCGGVDRFAVNERKNTFICRKGAVAGDAIALAQHLDDTNFLVACETVTGDGAPLSASVMPQPAAQNLELDENAVAKLARVRRLWSDAVDPRGTIAEKYLASRGLVLEDDIAGSVLRFHPAAPWLEDDEITIVRVLAMLAVFRDVITDEICGVQVWRLSPKATKLARKMRGFCGRGAIKLDPCAHITHGLTLGEGLETTLTGRQVGLRPAWALGSAGAIAKFPVLPGIDALTLLAETMDGCTNKRAVERCGCCWEEAGREVFVAAPKVAGDLNDALRRAAV